MIAERSDSGAHDLVTSYGRQRLRARTLGIKPHAGECGCLPCADLRELRGEPPLLTDIERMAFLAGVEIIR